MKETWDVIVIGAGIGGLAASARLMREGLRVLVVESDPHPGGTAYVYRRKEFDFPMGPLGFSNPDVMSATLARAGIEEDLAYKRVNYRLRAFGLDAPLSLPYPEMISALASLFPREEAGISRFFSHMAEISSRQDAPPGDGPLHPRKTESMSASSYLDGLVTDWRLRRILGSMGSREPYAGLPLLAAMWSLLCNKGIHYPAGGMRRLCDILAAKVGWGGLGSGEESGNATAPPETRGRLLLRTRIKGIVVEHGRVRGVILDDGTRLQGNAVICNADFKATFLRLLPREAVPGKLLRAVSAAAQTSSNLQVCLGFDLSRVDLSAFSQASRLIYRRHDGFPSEGGNGPGWEDEVIDPGALAGEELEATLISADGPELAPEGGAVLVIRVAAEHAHFTRFRPAIGKRSPQYLQYKTRLGNALVKEISGIVPGLEEAVTVMDVATPLTFEERGGRSEGAVAGWSWNYSLGADQSIIELVLTPITGLYMAGYQAFSMLAMGGVPSAALSGLKAAEYLLEGAGPVSEMQIPGA